MTKNLSTMGKKFDQEASAAVKGKAAQVDSDDDFVSPPVKKFKVCDMKENEPECFVPCTYTGEKISSRNSPKNLCKLSSRLSEDQKKVVSEMGFGSILLMKIHNIPTALAYWLIKNYDAETNTFHTGKSVIKITPLLVHRLLGIPNGGLKINELKKATRRDPVVAEWRSQFNADCKKVSVKDMLKMMKGRTDYGRLFKLNFLVVFNSIMGETTKSSTVNQRFLKSITPDCDVQRMSWCGYIITCLERTKKGWNGSERFNGPLILLAVLYANEQSQASNDRHNGLHAISCISSNTLNSLEDTLEGELFEKQLKACEDTKKDNNGCTTDQIACQPQSVNVEQGLEQEVDTPGNITGQNLVEDCSAQKIYSNEPTSDTNTLPKDGNEEVISTTPIISTPEHFEVTTQYLNDLGEYLLNPSGPMHIYSSPRFSQLYNDEPAEDTSMEDNEQGRAEELDKQLKEFEECILRVESVVQRASVDYPNSDAIRNKQSEWQLLLRKYMQQLNDAEVREGNFKTPPCQGETNKDDVRSTKDIPLFNISEEELGPSSGTIHIPPPLPVIKPIVEAVDVEVRKKRPATLSGVLRSPYVERPVKLGPKRTRLEDSISNYIFSATGFKWEIVYSTSKGGSVIRVLMETMSPGLCIHQSCISAWATLLNYEERFRSNDSPLRLFCSASMLIKRSYQPGVTSEVRINEFSSKMVAVLEAEGLTSLKGVDLVFIPILSSKEYYLLCFNMKTIQIDLIDNSGHLLEYKEKYRGWPEIMRNTFAGYLARVSHPRALQIKQGKISRMEMPWRTLNNKNDCGVFMMRHMETFKGTTIKDWKCGLSDESEKQQDELNDLRRKYVAKFLLHDMNMSKEFVISELTEYLKMDADVRRQLHDTAQQRILERLKNVE